MALTFIKSGSDKQKWQKAIELTKERKQLRDPSNPNYDSTLAPIENVFAYANWLYHNVLHESGSVVIEEKEEPGLIKNETQQKLWEWVEGCVFSDPKLKDLEETKKWEVTEDLYNEFVNKVPSDMPMDKLEEFVNLQGGYSGASNKGALFGMGGSRDEKPIGPIVYGSQNIGLTPLSNPFSTQGEPAKVIIPDKKDQYDPNAFKLDSLGNVTNDVKAAEQSSASDEIEDATPELFDILQELGYTSEQLEAMDDEDLQNVMKKAIKIQRKNAESAQLEESISYGKTIKQKLTEAFLYEDELLDEKETATSKARDILARKHKIGKALKKKDDKFILKQDDISKIIRQYGYTWNRKYKKWIRKFSPTFLARKLLSTKFQDAETVQKDKDGKYILNQDEISKRIKAKGLVWDKIKKMWVPKEEVSKPDTIAQTPDNVKPPETITVEPSTPEVEKPAEVLKQPIDTPVEEPEVDADEWEDSEVELNPLSDPSILNKMKLMQARMILGVAHGKPEYTQFDSIENVLTPKVLDKDVDEKIQQLGYSWDANKKLWLDQSLTIPNKLSSLEETNKTIIARSYLAALDKIKNIKVSQTGELSTSNEKLDDKMDAEGFVWDTQTQIWKYLGDQEDQDSDISSMLNEEVVYEEIKSENLKSPKKKYSLLDVAEVQARLLMRSLQYAWYRKFSRKDPAKARQIWDTQLADGMDDDPFNGKMDINVIEEYLNTKMSYAFNEDEDKPMWTEQNNKDKLPPILNEVGVNTEQEYIARGILGSKDINWAKIRAANPAKPQMTIPDKKVSMKMKDAGYGWNDEWGWVAIDENQPVTSKSELNKQNWLKDKSSLPFEQLKNDEKRQIKEYAGYRVAAKLINKTPQEWDNLSVKEKKKAMQELEKHYSFDTKKKNWVQREKPISSNFWNRLGKIASALGVGSKMAANAVTSAAKNFGRYN